MKLLSSWLLPLGLFAWAFTSCNFEKTTDQTELDTLLDSWHHAAAVADEDAFFGLMSEECVYIGTDETEKWKRDELRKWSERFFERDVAWAFTPRQRQIYFSEDEQTAWFDEKLDTWMGICRGSGVLVKSAWGWKIVHYHLAVTVPNEKIEGFIELVQGD
ncbi:MAG: nuclear transport factor 2 family protein [Vicingaceae bacterium]